jgi:hypothetical protein
MPLDTLIVYSQAANIYSLAYATKANLNNVLNVCENSSRSQNQSDLIVVKKI